MKTNQVSLIGAGVMGEAIGTRLLEMNHPLSVFDRNEWKVNRLVEKGGVAAQSAIDAATGADYIILSLNSAEVVRQVVLGDEHHLGFADQAQSGATIIDMSSIDPESTKLLATEVKKFGLNWLDCPLSGGAPKAFIGQLTVMSGGELEVFENAKVVMQDLCANYTHMGPSGAGQTTKLINQVLCALNFVAVAEATQLALDAGVDAEKIPQAIQGGRADSAILQEYMAKMARKDYTPTGRLDNMIKDLNGVQDLARSTKTPMPLTAVCAEIHRLLVSAGLGDQDNAMLMKFFEGPKA